MVRFDIFETNKDLPWLLFIHGFAGNAGTWKNQVFEFRNKFNICLVDLPGHGCAKLTEDDKKSKNIYTQIAKEIITKLKSLNIEKVNVISFSMGTVVNYFLLQEDSEFCERSIMVSPVCGGTKIENLKGDLMSNIQSFLPFNWVVNRFTEFILPQKEDFELRPDVQQACLDLGRENFLFWYKTLKKHYNVMLENSLSNFKNLYFIAGDRDLSLLHSVKYVANRDKLPFKLVENCSHLYPIQQKEDFHKYLYNILG